MSPRGGKRPGAGRPLTRDSVGACVIQIRVTDAEKRVLVEAAARAGESLSQWLRRIALAEAERR